MQLISKKSSLSDGFLKQRASFIKKDEELNEVLFYFEPRKNVKVKPIKSYKQRERYQAFRAFLPNYEWDWFKYIFTMMDHFTNYRRVIPLNYSKAENILYSNKNLAIYTQFPSVNHLIFD